MSFDIAISPDEKEEDRQKLWISERLDDAVRRQGPMNDACRRRFLAWTNYLDTTHKDPEKALVQLPRTFIAIEQATSDISGAFLDREPWFPMRPPAWVKDPMVKRGARGVTNLIQDCLNDSDAHTEMLIDSAFKQTMLFGNVTIETAYDYWYETYFDRSQEQIGSFNFLGPRTAQERLRQGVRLRIHPKWRTYLPENASFLTELDWHIIIEILTNEQAQEMVEEWRPDLDPEEVAQGQMETIRGLTDRRLSRTLMNWMHASTGSNNKRSMLIRCFQNGRDPYYTEFLNGKHELRRFKRFGRRWPLQMTRYTTEPRDNNIWSMGMVKTVEHSYGNMDDMLSVDLDLRFFAAEPAVFYNSRFKNELAAAGRLKRRQRIGVNVPDGQSIGNVIHIAPTVVPPDVGTSYHEMLGSTEQAITMQIGKGIDPGKLKTAKLTSEVAETVKEAEAARLRIIEIPLERTAEDCAALLELMPYEEMERRIGPEQAQIVEQYGVDSRSYPGGARFEMNAPRRKQSNLLKRQEIREIAKTWGGAIEKLGGNIIPLIVADLNSHDSLTEEQVELIIPEQLRNMGMQVSEQIPQEPGLGGEQRIENLDTANKMAAQDKALQASQ